jgi:hypothetical protein
MTNKNFYEGLSMLGFPMFEGSFTTTANETLAEVVKSKDIRFWEGFPVMLANSIEKDWFNYMELHKYLGSTKEVSTLDLLITMSLALYDLLNINSSQIEKFRQRFGPEKKEEFEHFVQKLKSNEDFKLSGKVMSGERIKNAMSAYYSEKQQQLTDLLSEKDKYDLQYSLSKIFPSGQRNLIMKKLKGEKLTKTEREYFSRVVKKKMLALENPELKKLAQKLLA